MHKCNPLVGVGMKMRGVMKHDEETRKSLECSVIITVGKQRSPYSNENGLQKLKNIYLKRLSL